MGAAKKIELFPDQEYIQRGLREGWITIQDLSMKAIVADPEHFQARVQSINMDHVHKLSMIRDTQDGAPLAPVVTFFDGKSKYYLADGFHRVEENKRRKQPAIRAYVAKVENWRHEAMLFSTMCNQEMSLARTKEDIRKAIEMLFADQECWTWSDPRIASHVGIADATARKYRAEYSLRNNVSLPASVVTFEGKSRPYRTASSSGIPSINNNARRGTYRCKIDGKSVDLGVDRVSAARKVEAIVERKAARKLDVRIDRIQSYLLNRGILAESCKTTYDCPGIRGLEYGDVVIASTDFSSVDSVPWSLGCVRMLRQYVGKPNCRMVVVCWPDDGPAVAIGLARMDGIEFLTPEELVASLKGEEGEANN